MKKVLNILFSTKSTVIFLIIFAIGMAVATFIEEKFDTARAKEMVYNAKWFEFVLLMLALNFIGNIKRYNLFRLQKAGSLTFHLAFILLIIGAGITRYIGSEGSMHIREGHSSNIIFDSEPNLHVKIGNTGEDQTSDNQFHYKMSNRNKLKEHLNSDAGPVQLELKQYVRNAEEIIEENLEGGNNIIELSVMMGRQREVLYISKGERKHIGNKIIVYGEKTENDDFGISDNNGLLSLISSHDISKKDMHNDMSEILPNGLPVVLENNYIYQSHDFMFILTNLYVNAKKKWVSSDVNKQAPDLLILDVTINDVNYEAQVFGGPGYRPVYQDFNFGGTPFAFAYGNKLVELGFSLFLEDFILERYPGSHSPSSFESHVIIDDPRVNLRSNYKIFMNNVLDYDGYRFFQSSYDPDEKGTILSVNHDRLGTFVTYLGYFLLGLGFILTPFSNRSRIQSLMKNIRELRNKRKALLLLVMFYGVNSLGFSQTHEHKTLQEEHAEKFGHLITISYEGRFSPIHTLANDVMHKISRKDEFDIEGKGKMNARQVFLDMVVDSRYWQQQKIIYVREKSVRDVLGIEGKHAAYMDFFKQQSNYKLREFVDNAFRKEPSTLTKFDKEIIKVDERVNICYMVYNGSMMKIFPEQGSDNDKWLSWTDSLAFKPLTGAIQGINEDLQLGQLSYYSLFQKYLIELRKSTNTGDYQRSDQILSYI
ncbi:MAG: cytochrome c biogenesis protein ResB, partial [Bacteroidales bacterium]|nr:cytochrome c biogenesis protein ResB [Bacteroidales bacterium]